MNRHRGTGPALMTSGSHLSDLHTTLSAAPDFDHTRLTFSERRPVSPTPISRSRAATFLVSVTSGPLSREIPGPRDTIDAGGCPQKRMTRSWSAASRLEAVDGKTTKQTQSRRTAVKSTASNDEPRSADLAFEIRGLCCVKASDSFVAHALSVPRRDSSRRPAQFGHPSSHQRTEYDETNPISPNRCEINGF